MITMTMINRGNLKRKNLDMDMEKVHSRMGDQILMTHPNPMDTLQNLQLLQLLQPPQPQQLQPQQLLPQLGQLERHLNGHLNGQLDGQQDKHQNLTKNHPLLIGSQDQSHMEDQKDMESS